MATIAENLQTIQNIKQDIKTAIENKGVTVGDSSFTDYPTLINNIPQENTGGDITLTNIDITTNGIYTAPDGEGYKTINVDVPSGGDTTTYSYKTPTADIAGLKTLGWDDESIGYFRDNNLCYDWQNDDYIVSEENKSLYGVVNANNIGSYQNNPDFIFCPLMDFSKDYVYLRRTPYLKGVPKFSNLIQTSMDFTFAECPELLILPPFDTSKITNMSGFVYGCIKLKLFPLLDTSNVTNMTQMFVNCSSLETIPLLDTGNVANMSSMFYGCSTLITIPELDTGNVTTMNAMFYNCSILTTIPELDTGNVINMSQMFYGCKNLTTIPLIDTSNVTNMNAMFNSCSSLITIPELDTGNVINMSQMFYNCSKLTSLPRFNVANVTSISTYFGYSNITTLTDVGGWENLKINWNDNYGLAKLSNLTYQSCINILNGLYDFVGNGETPTSSQGNLKVHSNFLTTVGDEISIGTNKGWVITA